MRLLDYIAQTPFTTSNLLGLVFLILCIVFAEMRQKTQKPYFSYLAWSMLFCSIAWGSISFQNPGKAYVDWGWWWAQPIYAFAVIALSFGVLNYLPLSKSDQAQLKWVASIPSLAYVALVTYYLLIGTTLIRTYSEYILIPPCVVMAIAAYKAEKFEPKIGHRLLGALALMLPFVIIVFPIFGAKAEVLRFWGAIPLITLALIILTSSLLREQAKIRSNIEQLFAAEAQLIKLNQDLENRVADRTSMLNEIINDLESFNRNISHDIRSPLGSMGMTAYLAKKCLEGGDVSSAQDQLDQIVKQVDLMQRMVTTMLELATSVMNEKNFMTVNLEELVRDKFEKINLQLKSDTSLQFKPRFQTQNLGSIKTDPSLLRIILDNLIGNALKFNHNRPNLEITVGQYSQHGEPCIYVKDNGIGFETQDSKKAFDPFERLGDVSRTPGHGLGLSIVQRAVKRLGGQTWAESKVGEGATFYFILPKIKHV